MTETIRLIRVFEENEEWFSEHLDELREKYEGLFVAVKDRKVIAVSRSLDELISKLENMGEDPDRIYIAPVPAKDAAFIL
ncbi:hypothetical protein DRO58_07775 [Candidatus Bathyarchaeota archaeon]|nr:MAG: hypothetical protein DRO58_07775 [Candidatus Bathyarchaeota archaeon]